MFEELIYDYDAINEYEFYNEYYLKKTNIFDFYDIYDLETTIYYLSNNFDIKINNCKNDFDKLSKIEQNKEISLKISQIKNFIKKLEQNKLKSKKTINLLNKKLSNFK